MDSGMITQWRQPLAGEYLDGIPMGPQSDWQALHEHARDVRLHDLAFGWGEQQGLSQLKDCCTDRGIITVWEARQAGRHVGWLVYSVLTSLPRASVYFFDTPWDQAAWRDGISQIADRFFMLEPDRNMLYAHVLLPVPDETEAWLYELGFAPADTAMYVRRAERAVYGLPRAVYDMFHEEIDEDEDAFDDDDI